MIRALDFSSARSSQVDPAAEAEEFCNRWKRDVFTFCRMFLGDGAAAEAVTCDVLLAFYHERGLPMRPAHEILPRLLKLAMRAMERYRNGDFQAFPSASRLEQAMQCLPPMERVVVIMRNLMRLDWEALALSTDLSQTEAHKIWVRAIVQLNELLQREFPKENH
jgi:DNA-directed RNA polymerase specialized sigma24 family protein